MLTKKQYELLVFIDQKLRETGVPPSFDEMKDALDLRSKSGIHRLITGLEERGFIRRLPHRARALEILRLPENFRAGDVQPARPNGFTPNVIEGGFRPKSPKPATGEEPRALPLWGRIAAGTHIDTPSGTQPDPTSSIDVPPSMLGRGEHFALEIDGDSMIDEGIHDGDTVVIERCDTAESGSIVAALVDGSEVTLKRLRRKGGTVALEPANKDHETRIFGPDRVQVQGRLVGLIRKY